MKRSYTVFIGDNFHYADKSYISRLDDYESLESAISACKNLIDNYLQKAYKVGMSEADLFNSYTTFGEEPFIDGEERAFSAWEYAKQCAHELVISHQSKRQ